MNLFIVKLMAAIPVIFFLIFCASTAAEVEIQKKSQKKTSSAGMEHINNTDIINTEKDFLKVMIQHHKEAIDTSILLFICTKDSALKKITRSIYTERNQEMLDLRLFYAHLYELIPTGTAYHPTMSDLNTVTGHERDIQYVLHMVVHHKNAINMAKKVLTINSIQVKTFKFAKDIIKKQNAEIKLLENWLKNTGALKQGKYYTPLPGFTT